MRHVYIYHVSQNSTPLGEHLSPTVVDGVPMSEERCYTGDRRFDSSIVLEPGVDGDIDSAQELRCLPRPRRAKRSEATKESETRFTTYYGKYRCTVEYNV